MTRLVSLLALFGWAIWIYTILYVEPEAPFARVPFYSGLFVALTCTLARLRETPRWEDSNGDVIPAKPSLGLGAILATLVLFAIWLQSLRMLTTLNVILLVLTLALIEVGFRLSGGGRRPKSPRRPRRQSASDKSRSAHVSA